MSRAPTLAELRQRSDMFLTDGSINFEYVPDFADCVLPYTRFFHDDFLGGTRGMSPDDGWPYTVMLMEMYSRGTALNISDDRLARLCGMSKSKFLKAKNYLIEEGKIVPLDTGLWNERAELTFILRQISKQDATAAGVASGKKRRKNKGRPERPLSESSADAEPSSEAQKLSIDGDDAGARARSIPSAFRERLLDAMGADPTSGLIGPNGRLLGTQADMLEAGKWTGDLGLVETECIAVITECMSRKRDGPPASFRYFSPAMQRLAGAKTQPKLTPIEGGQNAIRSAPPGVAANASDISAAADYLASTLR